MENSKPNFFVEITTTNDCNCKCAYCFENCRKIEQHVIEGYEDKVVSLLENACSQFDNTKFNQFAISFWGGEPFLNLQFLNHIVKATFKYPFVRYHVYSNGTLTSNILDFLNCDFIDAIRSRIHFQLSYDGEPHHSLKRGNNSAAIMATADLLSKNNIAFDFKATLSFDMIKFLPQIWDSYESLFIQYGNHAEYYPTLDTTSASLDYLDDWTKSLAVIVKKEYNFVMKHKRHLFGWFSNGQKRNCNVNNSMHIHTDGNIYVCHGCMYKEDNKNLIVGKLESTSNLFDVKIPSVDIAKLPSKCISCPATYCSICHVEQLSPTDDPGEKWISCKVNNEMRCNYFKIFGYFAKLLQFKLDENGYLKNYGR